MANEKSTLIKNVNIFDGTSEKLTTGKDVTLSGNKIDKIIDAGGPEDGYDEVIDGGGGTLMPGLSDVHTHLALCQPPPVSQTQQDRRHRRKQEGSHRPVEPLQPHRVRQPTSDAGPEAGSLIE